MLQNGTVISETLIEKPHSFFTACNVTTQIVAQVASNQYGGQSFTLAHLAPFVDISRKKIRKNVIEERKECGEPMDEAIIDKVTERRLREERYPDYSVPADHIDDLQWPGSICNCIYVPG
jgi:anaerobic ribonucleoside-triphosphate reductase